MSFQTVELTVEVIPSIWIVLDSEVLFIEEISSGQTAIFEVNVTNLGNIVADANVIISQLNDWNVVLNGPLLDDILPGET